MDDVLSKEWHVVCKASELGPDRPVGATIMELEVVTWRCGDEVLAWEDICVHRGVRLSLGTVCENRLRCAYHGWTYDGSGQCVAIPAHPEASIPARARAKAIFHAREHAGLIWVNLSDDPPELPAPEEQGNPAFRVVNSGPFHLNASGPRIIENFLDIAHFPFVHTGSLGTPEKPEMRPYNVEQTEEGFFARNVVVFQPDPDGSGMGQDVSYDYHLIAPLSVYLVKHVGENKLIILLNLRPESETSTIGYFSILMDYDFDVPAEEIDRFHSEILSQDKPIVEAQRPELLPLDLREEINLRSDRLAIAYRRHIQKLGLSFGTS